MTRQNDWAKRTLAKLREGLGGKCAECGAMEQLELDCISPTGHTTTPTGKSRTSRATHYRTQFANGNLQLLCKAHNAKKGACEPEDCPF